jgi:hypothetical protein
MKNIFNLRTGLMLFIAFITFSCGPTYHSNHGTASDRTGTNGATNGTGKVPR